MPSSLFKTVCTPRPENISVERPVTIHNNNGVRTVVYLQDDCTGWKSSEVFNPKQKEWFETHGRTMTPGEVELFLEEVVESYD